MPRFLKFTTLGLTAAFIFTLALAPCAHAQQDAQPVVTGTTTFTESVLLIFNGSNGASPQLGNLIQASDGNLYGTTYLGGAHSNGTVFKITPAGDYTLLHSFSTATTDGEQPESGLVQGTDGNLYGTTYLGGANGDGTVFQITSGGAFMLLHSFTDTDGLFPYGALVQGTDGNFYGTTYEGGANTDGTVFQITPGGTFTLLHSFIGTDGQYPSTGLVQGTDGNFYGATERGGVNGDGTVYQITSGGAFTLLHSFSTSTTDGAYPEAGLVQGTDGNFYGTTSQGGADGFGAVFKITSGGAFTQLHSFSPATTDGIRPYSGLVLGSDGNFYGTTESAGANSYGTVFQITSGGAFAVEYSFTVGDTDGRNPFTGLVQGTDGNFYGATERGGTVDGVIYKLTASPALAPPVQLTAPATVEPGAAFTLSYLVTNATSETLQQCFATNNAGDTTGWTGTKTAATTATTAMLTASTTSGTYTYTLTCGGMETGMVNIVVPTNLTFSSVTHNFGSLADGSSTSGTSNYGVQVKNTGVTAVANTGVSLSGSSAFHSQTNCPTRLAAGANCEILFSFAPTTPGAQSATWKISGTANGTTFTPSNGGTLSGTGSTVTGEVTLHTAGHNFGAVTVGATSPIYGTVLANSTTAPISLTYTNVTSPFLLSGSNCGATLAAGATCNLQFEFMPTATGGAHQEYGVSATQGGKPVTITTGNPATTVTGVTLTGTGQ